MGKDYAKNMFTNKRKRHREPPRLTAMLAVFLVAFVVSVSGYWVYAHNGLNVNLTTWVASAKSLVKHKADPAKVAKQQATGTSQDENSVRFDFYTELPKMQVTSAVVAEGKSPPPISRHVVEKLPRPVELTQIDDSIQSVIAEKKSQTKQAMQYTLQVGVFKDQVSASQLRLSLLLAGIEADVVKTSSQSYRVQQGSYASESQAKAMQRRLSKKGFDSEIKPVG